MGVMCSTSQCELRSKFPNLRVTNVIRIVTYYTLPPLESPDSSWMTRSQRSRRRDKDIYALFTVRGIPTQNEARWANDAMALRCCVSLTLACVCDLHFSSSRHVFSSFPRVSSCRKRVDIQKPSWYSFTVKGLQVRLMLTAAEIASTHHNKNTNCLVECRTLDDRRYSICVWRN